MASWTDRYWYSAEGIRLHYRDHDGPRDRPPILCIPGLTRNARDFEPVADRYAGDWRVLSVDLRGRGESDPDPNPRHYAPPFYVADLLKLLDQEGIADAVFIGTSLGGLCTMLLAANDSDRIAGTLLNDIGPEIDQIGLERIGGYVGKEAGFASWEDASHMLATRNADIYPNWSGDDWDRFARRLCHQTADGIQFQYDMRIAENFGAAANKPEANRWPLYGALAGRPVTILRGELSDLLSQEVAGQMAKALGEDAELVVVPDVGHAPTLEEPEAQDAIDRLLERVMARQEILE
jgi:pimeloyl-ACP methyl ester carboxylesterase